MSTGKSEPEPYKTYGVEKAKKEWSGLIGSGEIVRLTRSTTDGETMAALVVPVRELSGRQRAALPAARSYLLTEARKVLGALVASAAGGAPQRLQRRGKDVAVLLPDTPEVAADDLGQGLAGGSGTAAAGPYVPATSPGSPGSPSGSADVAGTRPRRRLVTQADALNAVSDTGGRTASYGLRDLDQATGGLRPGRLALVAAAPGVGGSLLAVSAARATAVLDGRPVLYAAVGLDAATVSCRVAASHAGTNYQRLRAGSAIDADIQARITETYAARLFVDEGADLDVAAIDATVPDIKELALVVVDRLHADADPSVPLSGAALPAATRALTGLARTHDVPVLAVVDTDDPALLGTLRADVVLRLQRDGDIARLAFADTDFGSGYGAEEVTLWPDFAKARFVEDPPVPSAAPVRTPAAPAPPPVPNTPAPGGSVATKPPKSRPAAPRSGSTDPDVADQIRGNVAEALQKAGGDADAAAAALKRRAIPDVMRWFDMSRKGSRYEHSSFPPVLDLLKKTGQKSGADAIWEGRLNWKNEPVRSDATVREVTALDANGAYLAAFKTHLPIGQLTWSDDGEYDPKRSGIYRITPPAWEHTDLPNPLGDRRKTGDVWITDPTLRLYLRCARDGLCEAPSIHESWTSGSTEHLLEKLRRTLAEVRREAVEQADEVTLAYLKAAYSKFISTMGESTFNRELRRMDWMHALRSQAFANLWIKAKKAKDAGLVLVEATGTDELHVAGDWRRVFTEGRDLSEMKLKRTYTLEGAA